MTCFDGARLLDAYVDDELDATEQSRFAAHLDTCPLCARAVDGRLALRRAVHTLPYYGASDALRAALVANTRRARLPRRFAFAAAALVIIAAGAASVLRMTQLRATTRAIAASVVADHVIALQTSRIVAVQSSDQHTVKPWFLGKIDFAPPVNDLAAAGFPLAGGRLATIDGRSVAVLVYQRRLHPIDVFVWPGSDTRSRAAEVEVVRGFNVRHWTASEMSFWAVTDASAADLEALELSIRGAAVR